MNAPSYALVGYFSLVAAAAVIVVRWKFASPQFLILITLVTPTFGYLQALAFYGPAHHSYFTLLVPLFFALGTAINLGRKEVGPHLRLTEDDERRGFRAVLLVLALAAVWHFGKVGIPLFQSNVETSRFQSLGQSGLFGIPSRAVLFGIPTMAVVSIIRRENLGRRNVFYSVGLYVLTGVCLGFKGGILSVMTLVCVGLLIKRVANGKDTLRRFAPAILVAIFLGFLYVLQVASRYQGLANSTGITYLWKRLTFIGSEPAWFANMFGLQLTHGTPIYIHDTYYFMQKYFNITTGTRFGFDSLVSSLVTGTPITESAFLVPVTIGAGSYLALSCNVIVGTLILIALGTTYSSLIQKCRSTTSTFSTIIASAVIIAIPSFLIKGGGMYTLINNFVITLVIVAIFRLSIFWKSKTLPIGEVRNQ